MANPRVTLKGSAVRGIPTRVVCSLIDEREATARAILAFPSAMFRSEGFVTSRIMAGPCRYHLATFLPKKLITQTLTVSMPFAPFDSSDTVHAPSG